MSVQGPVSKVQSQRGIVLNHVSSPLRLFASAPLRLGGKNVLRVIQHWQGKPFMIADWRLPIAD
jgi:hypothetical protein